MRKLLILFFIFSCIQALSQEKLMPVISAEIDSVQTESERQILYRQLLPELMYGVDLSNELNYHRFNMNKIPSLYSNQFNFNEIIKPLNVHSTGINTLNFIPSPFFREEKVFNGAIYKLNNKFNLGGYSFGANSIFSAPFPNQQINNFDTRGATMFFQYNVSKNFKIETRVNVIQGYGPGF